MTINELEEALKNAKNEDPQTEQGKLELLAKLVKISKDALSAAMLFADEHALSFTFSEEYGDRRQDYHGKGTKKRDWQDSGCEWDDSVNTQGVWTSSSDDC